MLTPDEQAVMNLTDEADVCRAVGMEYLSIPIPDFGVPIDASWFEQGVAHVVHTLSQNKSVAVHCRGSIGRSGLLTCAALVAMGVPLKKAVATASDVRGVPVPESPEQRRWLAANRQRFANLVSSGSPNP